MCRLSVCVCGWSVLCVVGSVIMSVGVRPTWVSYQQVAVSNDLILTTPTIFHVQLSVWLVGEYVNVCVRGCVKVWRPTT